MSNRWIQKRLRKMADLCGDGLILDIGFASHPNIFFKGEIVGVDIKQAETPPNYNETVAASGEALPFVNQFDAISAGEIIEHLEKPVQFLVGCNDALKQGGKLILSTPNPYHLVEILKNIFGIKVDLFTDTHFYLFSYRFMLKLLELTGFSFVSCHGNYFKMPVLPLRIPTGRFPTISSNIIYYSKKMKCVRLEDTTRRMWKAYHSYYDNYYKRHGKLPAWRR